MQQKSSVHIPLASYTWENFIMLSSDVTKNNFIATTVSGCHELPHIEWSPLAWLMWHTKLHFLKNRDPIGGNVPGGQSKCNLKANYLSLSLWIQWQGLYFTIIARNFLRFSPRWPMTKYWKFVSAGQVQVSWCSLAERVRDRMVRKKDEHWNFLMRLGHIKTLLHFNRPFVLVLQTFIKNCLMISQLLCMVFLVSLWHYILLFQSLTSWHVYHARYYTIH